MIEVKYMQTGPRAITISPFLCMLLLFSKGASVSSPLESELALWFALANRMQQK